MNHNHKPLIIKSGLWFFIFILSIISAKSQTVSFNTTSVNGNFCAPSIISFNPVFSSAPIDFIWDFGVLTDEDYRAANPTITYLVPGTYKVTLTALFQNMVVTAVENITIYGLPDFTIVVDRNYICQPGDITFTAQPSIPVATYTWNFDDGTTLVNEPSGTLAHTFNGYMDYNINVTATTIQGCSTLQSIPVSVSKPSATLTYSPKNGCLPADVTLQADVLLPAGSTVSNYSWNFGDGSPSISNSANQVNHIYNLQSGGRPTLNITTSEGCTNTFTFDSIFFGSPPQPVFLSTDKITICFSETGTFRAKAGGADSYKWDFGDNISLLTVDTLVTHKFTSLNKFKVNVTPLFNGCEGTSESIDISVVGVKAAFALNNYCAKRDSFILYTTSLGTVTNLLWNFGDGSPTSNLAAPRHIFPDDSKFTTTLVVYDSISNCKDSVARHVYTTILKLIPTDSFVCRNSMVTLKVEGVDIAAGVSYFTTLLGKNIWNYGPKNNFVTQKADSSGIFKNRVIVYVENKCADTLVQTLHLQVGGPMVDFDRPEFLCFSDQISVQNKTQTAFSYHQITNWSWNFGDSIHLDNKISPSPFSYDKPGKYWISLKATDSKGCLDSIRKQTMVNPLPFIAVSSSSSIACPGDSVRLNAIHQGNIRWSPVLNVSCDTCSSIYVTPIQPTVYTAAAFDTIGCTNSFKVNLNTYPSYALNPILRDTGFCFGGSVQLNPGIEEEGLTYRWTPNTGLSDPTIFNPIASPLSSTIYQLNIIDSAGCFPTSAQMNVIVHALPVIDSTLPIIVPYNGNFTLNPTYGPDIVSYLWNPITQLNCTTCPYPSGIALESITYTIKAFTSHGCMASATIQLQLDCKAENLLMPTAFTPNGDNLNEYFYPIARGMNMVHKFIIFNRYGQVVFERSNFKPNDENSGWDGYIQGKLQPAGNYLYSISAICSLGFEIHKKGSVMLIR